MNERRFVDMVRDALLSSGIDPGRPLVAAVSGGADSMSLLEALRQLADEAPVQVVAAHFNHGLRGAESDADERFVVDWCAGHGIRCVTGHWGRGRPTRSGQSPEAAARKARYAFLSRVQADAGASAVATGHTMDDQAETVLLHLVRGSGLAGLRGMRPLTQLRTVPTLPPITVVRPLLGLRRADTGAFCEARGIRPRRDPTNEDLTVPRNRLRHQVVPLLTSITPGATASIARLTAAASDDLDFLSAAVGSAWAKLRPPRISRAGFKRLHPAIKRRILMRMHAQAVTGDDEDGGLGLDHVEAMLALASGRPGTTLDLSRGVRFEVGYRHLAIAPAPADTTTTTASPSEPECPFPSRITSTPLPVPGAVDLGDGFVIRAEKVTITRLMRASRWTAYVDADLAERSLVVRPRSPGDRFVPSGMSAEKKLQDFFVDEKVPRQWRDRVPLVESAGGIVWVVGYRVSQPARARGPGEAIRLRAKRTA